MKDSMIDANQVPNLGSLVREAAQRFADKTILRFEGSSLSFAELETRTNQLANVLEKLGVKAGDRVAVMLGNGFDFPITWLSIAKLGAIMVPVNTQYQHDDLRFVLRDSGAWLLVTSPEFVALADQVQPEVETFETIATFGALLLLWILDWAGAARVDTADNLFAYLSLVNHYEALLKGVFRSSDVLYYALFILSFLALSIRRLDADRLQH